MNEVIIADLRYKVFLDADIAIGMGKPPGNWIFQRLVDLVNVGLLSIVTTELTIGQIVKHHVNDAYKTLEPLRESHFRNVVSNVLGIDLPHKRNADWRLTRFGMLPRLSWEPSAIPTTGPLIVLDPLAFALYA